MESHKLSKLVNDSTASRCMTRKWIKLYGQYSHSKNIEFKTILLRSDLYDYGDVNIVLEGTIDR